MRSGGAARAAVILFSLSLSEVPLSLAVEVGEDADASSTATLEREDEEYMRPSQAALTAWWDRVDWRPGPDLSAELKRAVPGINGLVAGDAFEIPGNDGKALNSALTRALELSRTGPPGLRPWFLLVADGLAVRMSYTLPDSLAEPFSRRAVVIGSDTLQFQFDTLGTRWVPVHDLLWRVWNNFGNTPAGERALVILSDLGWDTSCCCDSVYKFFEVIRRGEEFLGGRPLSPLRGEVHLLLGRAYETWWSMGAQEPSEDSEVDVRRSRHGVDRARERALAHYGEVLRLLPPGGPDAGYARRHSAPIQRGIDTGQRSFLCFYE